MYYQSLTRLFVTEVSKWKLWTNRLLNYKCYNSFFGYLGLGTGIGIILYLRILLQEFLLIAFALYSKDIYGLIFIINNL